MEYDVIENSILQKAWINQYCKICIKNPRDFSILELLFSFFQVRDIFNSVSSVERMDLDYDQRHYKHPKDKKSEVKHSGDGESDKQFSEPDQWNRKLKYRHKSSEAGDDVLCEPTVFSSMLDTESTV